MAGRGHPRAFATAEELEQSFKDNINYCVETQRFPNVAGFCAYKWITRETFYKQQEYYSDTYNKIRQILEDEVLQDNSYRMQLYLKNTFGYTDKVQTENTNLNHEMTEAEANKILKKYGINE